jgi:hypothetical protein
VGPEKHFAHLGAERTISTPRARGQDNRRRLNNSINKSCQNDLRVLQQSMRSGDLRHPPSSGKSGVTAGFFCLMEKLATVQSFK